MGSLWDWFRARGRANDEPVEDERQGEMGKTVRVRKSGPAYAEAAVEKVAAKWDQDGDRADQDYYHVPGGGNPDAKDPPRLDGERLDQPAAAKPRRRGRAHPGPQ